MTARRTTDLSRTKKALVEAEAVARKNDLAIRAHQMRREGIAWWDIAEELGITEQVAARLVSDRIAAAAELVDQGQRRTLLTMELDRLDQLQRAVWADAIGGDTRAVETALKIIDKRAKLLGLENATGQTVTNNTIVVPGNTIEYVAALRAVHADIVEAS